MVAVVQSICGVFGASDDVSALASELAKHVKSHESAELCEKLAEVTFSYFR